MSDIKYLSKISIDINRISNEISRFLAFIEVPASAANWTSAYEETHAFFVNGNQAEAKKLASTKLSYGFLLYDFLISCNKDLFYDLNLIIISGEQYFVEISGKEFREIDTSVSKFNSIHYDLVKKVTTFYEANKTAADIQNIEALLNYLNEKLNPTVVIKSIDKIKRLFRTVQQNVRFLNYQTFLYGSFEEIVEIKEITEHYYSRKFDIDTGGQNYKDDYIVLLINIKLAEIDDSLTCNENEIRELITLKNLLTNEEFRQKNSAYIQTEILIEKSQFLSKKVYERLKKESIQFIDDTSLDFEPEVLKGHNGELKFFADFDRNLIKHKQISSESYYRMKRLLRRLNSRTASVTDFHHLIRYYRIKQEKLYKYEELINLFNERAASVTISSEFDNASYSIARVFFANCAFRRMVEIFENKIAEELKPDMLVLINKFEEIQKKYDSLKLFCDQIYKYNYYYHYLFAKATTIYISALNMHYDNRMSDVNENKMLSLIEKFRDAITSIKQNLKWSTDHSVAPFYVPYSECVSEVDAGTTDNEKIKIFLDSSYVLPNNFEKFKNQLSALEDDFISNRAILLHKILSSKAAKIDSKGEEINDSVRKSQKEYLGYSVQILTIFVTILAFIFGSINVVPSLRDMKSVGVFLVGFASSLALFVLLINFIIQLFDWSRNIFWDMIKRLVFIALTGILFYFIINYSYNKIMEWGNQPFNPIHKESGK